MFTAGIDLLVLLNLRTLRADGCPAVYPFRLLQFSDKLANLFGAQHARNAVHHGNLSLKKVGLAPHGDT